VDDKHSTKAVI